MARFGLWRPPEIDWEQVRSHGASTEDLLELRAVYRQHGDASTQTDSGFQRFVAAQLAWDRAMAEAIVAALERYPGHQFVGVMGRGHAAPGAVPHQLRALGVDATAVLLPWDIEPGCEPPPPGSASAVFGVRREPAAR